jgi:putative redox protein
MNNPTFTSKIALETKRITFTNADGLKLSARLELPMSVPPAHYAIFAHCFTCGKGIKAATVISRKLTQAGFGVLRFDFTGLGQSEGSFEETNFTSNISDISSAAAYLSENYTAPKLLVGHSLGGTAVLHAAAEIESIEAVCTIGAPAEAVHVMHHIEGNREEIMENGKALVNIGGRPFNVGAKFITDLEQHSTSSLLHRFRKAILIMHSPQDTIVGIDNAAAIYQAARHPKSFISLDGVDHLLQNDADSEYVAQIIGVWISRYITLPAKPAIETKENVAVQLGSDGYTTEIVAGEHRLLADEPKEIGGNNMGPTPYQLLNAALGACTAMTLKMYAERKKWPLEKVTVHLSHSHSYVTDASNPESKGSKVDAFSRTVEIKGDLDDGMRSKLLEIANKCPVHRTLTETEVKIETRLKL